MLLTGKFYVTAVAGNGLVGEGWYYAYDNGQFIDGDFYTEGDVVRYIVGGQAIDNGFVMNNGGIYFVADGVVQSGKFYVTEDSAEDTPFTAGWYYTEADGAFKTGFVNDEGVLRYVKEGKTAASGAMALGEEIYVLDWNGEVRTGKFYVTEESAGDILQAGWYYADENGEFIENDFFMDGSVKRYIVNGQAAYLRVANINGSFYMIGWNGEVTISDRFYITESSTNDLLKGAGWYKTDASGAIIVE